MKSITIKNVSSNEIISKNGYITTSFYERFRGLLGKKELIGDEFLLINPCNSVHMFFMKFEIDVIFIDKNNKVCEIIKSLKPWKISNVIKKAKYVIELKSGTIECKNIKIGNEIKYYYN